MNNTHMNISHKPSSSFHVLCAALYEPSSLQRPDPGQKFVRKCLGLRRHARTQTVSIRNSRHPGISSDKIVFTHCLHFTGTQHFITLYSINTLGDVNAWIFKAPCVILNKIKASDSEFTIYVQPSLAWSLVMCKVTNAPCLVRSKIVTGKIF